LGLSHLDPFGGEDDVETVDVLRKNHIRWRPAEDDVVMQGQCKPKKWSNAAVI